MPQPLRNVERGVQLTISASGNVRASFQPSSAFPNQFVLPASAHLIHRIAAKLHEKPYIWRVTVIFHLRYPSDGKLVSPVVNVEKIAKTMVVFAAWPIINSLEPTIVHFRCDPGFGLRLV